MAKIAVFIINFYRSQLFFLKLPSCRFYPTCSEYAITCLEKFGFIKSVPRIFWRIIRCNPFLKGGFDPVPSESEIVHNSKHNRGLGMIVPGRDNK